MAISSGESQIQVTDLSEPSSRWLALTSLTSLFFMWGLITCLNDILIPHLKNLFELNYTQAMLIQFCFFGAYFIMSIPAGTLVSRLGYQRGIVTGLIIAAVGCVLFFPAANMLSYPLFLGALFVLASGITVLQVSANPYVSVLGSPETASSRLTMTQAFNSLGTTVAPVLGGWLILSAATESAASGDSVQSTYLLLALTLVILALAFAFIKLPKITHDEPAARQLTHGSALQHKHLVLGALGIFTYVGAEVGIGSLLINFMGMDHIAALSEKQASTYVSYFWGGAMVGRFVGALVMQKINAGKVLAFNALFAVLLVATTIVSSDQLAMWSLLLVGLCNSIMFPTIFSLALKDLKQHTAQGSGILCLAIVGGAVLPLFQGMLADHIGLQWSFIMPLCCFVFIAWYGLVGSKPVPSAA